MSDRGNDLSQRPFPVADNDIRRTDPRWWDQKTATQIEQLVLQLSAVSGVKLALVGRLRSLYGHHPVELLQEALVQALRVRRYPPPIVGKKLSLLEQAQEVWLLATGEKLSIARWESKPVAVARAKPKQSKSPAKPAQTAASSTQTAATGTDIKALGYTMLGQHVAALQAELIIRSQPFSIAPRNKMWLARTDWELRYELGEMQKQLEVWRRDLRAGRGIEADAENAIKKSKEREALHQQEVQRFTAEKKALDDRYSGSGIGILEAQVQQDDQIGWARRADQLTGKIRTAEAQRRWEVDYQAALARTLDNIRQNKDSNEVVRPKPEKMRSPMQERDLAVWSGAKLGAAQLLRLAGWAVDRVGPQVLFNRTADSVRFGMVKLYGQELPTTPRIGDLARRQADKLEMGSEIDFYHATESGRVLGEPTLVQKTARVGGQVMVVSIPLAIGGMAGAAGGIAIAGETFAGVGAHLGSATVAGTMGWGLTDGKPLATRVTTAVTFATVGGLARLPAGGLAGVGIASAKTVFETADLPGFYEQLKAGNAAQALTHLWNTCDKEMVAATGLVGIVVLGVGEAVRSARPTPARAMRQEAQGSRELTRALRVEESGRNPTTDEFPMFLEERTGGTGGRAGDTGGLPPGIRAPAGGPSSLQGIPSEPQGLPGYLRGGGPTSYEQVLRDGSGTSASGTNTVQANGAATTTVARPTTSTVVELPEVTAPSIPPALTPSWSPLPPAIPPPVQAGQENSGGSAGQAVEPSHSRDWLGNAGWLPGMERHEQEMVPPLPDGDWVYRYSKDNNGKVKIAGMLNTRTGESNWFITPTKDGSAQLHNVKNGGWSVELNVGSALHIRIGSDEEDVDLAAYLESGAIQIDNQQYGFTVAQIRQGFSEGGYLVSDPSENAFVVALAVRDQRYLTWWRPGENGDDGKAHLYFAILVPTPAEARERIKRRRYQVVPGLAWPGGLHRGQIDGAFNTGKVSDGVMAGPHLYTFDIEVPHSGNFRGQWQLTVDRQQIKLELFHIELLPPTVATLAAPSEVKSAEASFLEIINVLKKAITKPSSATDWKMDEQTLSTLGTAIRRDLTSRLSVSGRLGAVEFLDLAFNLNRNVALLNNWVAVAGDADKTYLIVASRIRGIWVLSYWLCNPQKRTVGFGSIEILAETNPAFIDSIRETLSADPDSLAYYFPEETVKSHPSAAPKSRSSNGTSSTAKPPSESNAGNVSTPVSTSPIAVRDSNGKTGATGSQRAAASAQKGSIGDIAADENSFVGIIVPALQTGKFAIAGSAARAMAPAMSDHVQAAANTWRPDTIDTRLLHFFGATPTGGFHVLMWLGREVGWVATDWVWVAEWGQVQGQAARPANETELAHVANVNVPDDVLALPVPTTAPITPETRTAPAAHLPVEAQLTGAPEDYRPDTNHPRLEEALVLTVDHIRSGGTDGMRSRLEALDITAEGLASGIEQRQFNRPPGMNILWTRPGHFVLSADVVIQEHGSRREIVRSHWNILFHDNELGQPAHVKLISIDLLEAFGAHPLLDDALDLALRADIGENKSTLDKLGISEEGFAYAVRRRLHTRLPVLKPHPSHLGHSQLYATLAIARESDGKKVFVGARWDVVLSDNLLGEPATAKLVEIHALDGVALTAARRVFANALDKKRQALETSGPLAADIDAKQMYLAVEDYLDVYGDRFRTTASVGQALEAGEAAATRDEIVRITHQNRFLTRINRSSSDTSPLYYMTVVGALADGRPIRLVWGMEILPENSKQTVRLHWIEVGKDIPAIICAEIKADHPDFFETVKAQLKEPTSLPQSDGPEALPTSKTKRREIVVELVQRHVEKYGQNFATAKKLTLPANVTRQNVVEITARGVTVRPPKISIENDGNMFFVHFVGQLAGQPIALGWRVDFSERYLEDNYFAYLQEVRTRENFPPSLATHIIQKAPELAREAGLVPPAVERKTTKPQPSATPAVNSPVVLTGREEITAAITAAIKNGTVKSVTSSLAKIEEQLGITITPAELLMAAAQVSVLISDVDTDRSSRPTLLVVVLVPNRALVTARIAYDPMNNQTLLVDAYPAALLRPAVMRQLAEKMAHDSAISQFSRQALLLIKHSVAVGVAKNHFAKLMVNKLVINTLAENAISHEEFAAAMQSDKVRLQRWQPAQDGEIGHIVQLETILPTARQSVKVWLFYRPIFGVPQDVFIVKIEFTDEVSNDDATPPGSQSG